MSRQHVTASAGDLQTSRDRNPPAHSRQRAEGQSAYRPDIDGLRAFAVAAVVLFHAEVPGYSGGFVGVDVFFVISGYLITQQLGGSTDEPLLMRLSHFYIRRARRILPALFATSLVVAAAAVYILLPWDLARFGDYLAATSALGTNVAAWLERISYFQSRAAHVPIMHFWSIAIEEQFYLIYPITLALIARYFPRHRTTTLMALAALSFAASVWGSYHSPAANFFMGPTRAWELLLGGALATTRKRGIQSRLANELLAVGGLAALAVAVYRFGSTMPYPGLYAIAPCAASAILIHCGQQQSTMVIRLLSLRPVVFTGLISYSLYLWHFPVLVLFNYYNIQKIGPFALGMLIAFVYIIAVVSWKWIEMPVRTGVFLNHNRSFLVSMFTLNIVILTTGVVLWKSDGLPWRFPPEVQALANDMPFTTKYLSGCVQIPFDKIASGGLCSFGPSGNDAVRGLVWGDSHTMALLPAYEKLAESHHMRLYFAAHSSCRPLLGLTNRRQSNAAQAACEGFNAAVAQAVRRLDPRLLILNARWIDAEPDPIPASNADVVPGESDFGRALSETLHETESANRSVCVVLDVPTFQYNLANALGVARRRGIAEDFLKVSRAQAFEQYRGLERDIHALEQRGMLRSVDPKDLLCRADTCAFEADGSLLYRDGDHLSSAGATFVASVIDECFKDIVSSASR